MRFLLVCLMGLLPMAAWSQIDPELSYRLKASVVKVHVVTQSGGHGVGTGVVVGKDLVATNCHILANAKGANVAKFGETFAPVGLKADWAHDVCLLRFQYLEMQPVELGDSESLTYEQAIFTIGFPGGPPKPQVNKGRVKALYPHDGATVVRTDASFVMGASGSPVFDATGKLIALSTFKSPGRGAYYYNIPVKWVKALMDAPEVTGFATDKLPFWDAPPDQLPYFMQVLQPYQQQDWVSLRQIAQNWVRQQPQASESYYYLGLAQMQLGLDSDARQTFEAALQLQKQHYPSVMALGLIAAKAGKAQEVEHIHVTLKAVDESLDEEFSSALKAQGHQ
jgi:serine protease Do